MNPAFLSFLEEEIIECRLIKSSHVADIWMLSLASGIYCIKHYTDRNALLRKQAESEDLKLLSEVIPDAVPSIHEDLLSRYDAIVLCLDWIENSHAGNLSQKSVAEVLSELHHKKYEFAGLHYSNFIGELIQFNEPEKNWSSFWVNNRLAPQLKLAIDNDLLQTNEFKLLENYISKVPEYLSELNHFSLLHGDLWSGNVLRGADGKTYLIDPAIYYGDPWVDLSMTKLFGGFDQQFYDEYFEMSQIDKRKEELIPHYQVYYLMVHLNMFGRSYYPDIAGILRRYI